MRRCFDREVIIILDEYDTPMQEAWISGYWDEAAEFFSSFFNSTFKTNPCLYRGLITGITRISKESIFSGLMVELSGRFVITSNKESGFGRYDVMLTPVDRERDYAYIIEFKVHKPLKEKNLKETAANALAQIDQKQYESELAARGYMPGKIRKYGFAFRGKECLIETASPHGVV